MTAISVSERLLEMAAFYTPLALTVTVDPIPKLRFVLCAIRDTNEHIGQLILLQLELISIPFE